jgi:hypothetical protein
MREINPISFLRELDALFGSAHILGRGDVRLLTFNHHLFPHLS